MRTELGNLADEYVTLGQKIDELAKRRAAIEKRLRAAMEGHRRPLDIIGKDEEPAELESGNGHDEAAVVLEVLRAATERLPLDEIARRAKISAARVKAALSAIAKAGTRWNSRRGIGGGVALGSL